jgi:hypothetical protein
VKRFSLTHLSDEVLRKELTRKARNEKEATAELLAHIAEFDERKLYLPAAYESMLAYCVGELGLSEDAAKKRIQVARAAKACPEVFEALAAGRVHLSGLRLLAPRLSAETAEELLASATGKSMDEIERLLGQRYPRVEVAARVDAVPPAIDARAGHLPAPEVVGNPVSEGAARHPDRTRVTPLSAEAYAVQFTRSREADERFRYLQDLLGDQVKPHDLAEVYDRAVKELVKKLERVRFAACDRPRRGGRRADPRSRHVAAKVRRAVWQRDNGQCTFESESGRRCQARCNLHFDHVKEYARGGEATVANLRLRCRGHNQHTAEQTYGAGFMKAKREEATAAAARRRAEREKQAEEARLQPHELEVLPWLRQLGCREAESRIAAMRCREMADAPLEDRVKRALSWFGARLGRKEVPVREQIVSSPAL